MTKNTIRLLIVLCIAVCSVLFFPSPIKTNLERVILEHHIKEFQSAINEKEALLQKIVSNPAEFAKQHQHVRLYKYVQDSLVFWSSNDVPISINANQYSFYSPLIHLKNGWYLAQKNKINDTLFVALYRIQSTYEFENDYLKTEFSEDLPDFPKSSLGLQKISDRSFPIQTLGKNMVFYLTAEHNLCTGIVDLNQLVVWLIMIGIFLLGWISIKIDPSRAYIILCLLFLLRIIMLYFEFPRQIFPHGLFDPAVFFSSWWAPTIGDLILHAFLLIGVCYVHTLRPFPKTVTFILVLILGTLNLILTPELILNSSLELSIQNIAAFGLLEYIAYALIILFLLGYFFLFRSLYQNLKHTWTVLILFTPLIVLFFNDLRNVFAFIIASTIYALFLSIKRLWPSKPFWFHGEILVLGLVGVSFLSISMFGALHERQKNEMSFLVEDQKNQHDLSLELNMQEYRVNLEKYFSQTVFEINPQDIDIDEINKELIDHYLAKHQNHYEVKISICYGPNFEHIISTTTKKSYPYFEHILKNHGQPTICPELSFIENSGVHEDYIFSFILKDLRYPDQYKIYLSFKRIGLTDRVGFTDILQNKSSADYIRYYKYSFATYENKTLTHSSGSFIYPRLEEDLKSPSYHEFKHLTFKDQHKTYVASVKKPNFYDFITLCSYLFFFYFILLNSGLLLFYLPSFRSYIQRLYGKVQFTLFVLFFVVLVISVTATYYYLWAGFEYRNRDVLKDKLRSISIEVKEKLVQQGIVNESLQANLLRAYLDKFSHIFYTDINIFDQQGSLVSSSILNVFQQGVISEKMNPVAYKKLSQDNASEYLQREKIGDLQHLSGYIPLYRDDGSFLAYLHLPYFLKNEAFRIEWTYFITSILNIYVIIFMLFFFIVALLGEWITQPLKRIKELISNISLDDNKAIVYNKSDELGDLIMLYNKKVEELREKSNELSMVEKEMAWNEMARQIAHEIKNPLTPMKLSVQHLSRILKTEDQETLKKFERLMIEQIDALAKVASDFGDFAKTDRISLSEFVLEEIITPVVQLYAGTHTNLVVNLKSSQRITVMADKDQMTRVFNNLIKNAVQSIPKEESGHINISLEQQENDVLVKIYDNGKGIPDEIKPKLFTPNFTTKSEGTGLGLAIVKKIIEQHQGEIWFESEIGRGTTFFLRIPVYKKV